MFTGQGLLKRQPTEAERAEFATDADSVAAQTWIRVERPLG